MLLLISFMFERFTKKATDNAVENVKKTLNDRIDEYGDIIKIGLVVAVIILGGKHFTNTRKNRYDRDLNLPTGNGQPIIINNYYSREREEREERRYGRREETETYRSRGTSRTKR